MQCISKISGSDRSSDTREHAFSPVSASALRRRSERSRLLSSHPLSRPRTQLHAEPGSQCRPLRTREISTRQNLSGASPLRGCHACLHSLRRPQRQRPRRLRPCPPPLLHRAAAAPRRWRRRRVLLLCSSRVERRARRASAALAGRAPKSRFDWKMRRQSGGESSRTVRSCQTRCPPAAARPQK